MPNGAGPLQIQLGRLSESADARLRRLAARRGWTLLSSDDAADVDLDIRSAGDTAPAPRPGAVLVEVFPRGAAIHHPTGKPGDGHELPEEADDAAWIAILENAGRSARALRELQSQIGNLERISVTDPLTRIFNRMHLVRVMAGEYKRFERSGEPLACIMIDIDHFKNINDTYGHKFGDKVLSVMAELLQESIRASDVLGRYGGEEFLCILPQTDLGGATALAEKLRRAVEEKSFNEGFFNIQLTASFGVSCSTQAEISDADQLLQLADRALYRAKQTGRNRVCVADGTIESAGHAPSPEPAQTVGDGPVLLLAHPNPERSPLLHVLRTSEMFKLEIVRTSEEAAEFIARHPPAAALLHANMRPISGWELLRRIKSQTADHYFPIAILQPADATLPHRMIERFGADDIFAESIDPWDLERILRLFLRLKHLHDRFSETYDRLTAARARLVKAERLSALGEMASGVAHDFNNVLSAILGRTERLMARTSGKEDIKRDLAVIHTAASDVAKTIKRIQEFSRSISHLDSAAVPLADIVQDCLQLTRTRWKDEAERAGIKVKITAEVDPALQTSGNASEIREIFVNLLVNALDAMPAGGDITIRSMPPNGTDKFAVEITDTGTGMEPGVVKRIFEPFFTTKRDKGTGLGLSIIYGILIRLGGHIEVESHPGSGTTFRLWFLHHVAEAPSSSELPAPAIETVHGGVSERLKILVVDDEVLLRELFLEVLAEEGHEAHGAECARKAMEMAGRESYDVVLTDLSMPDAPGWDVARFVKERSRGTFVILTSGWGEEYTPEFLNAHGVDRWLAKPVSLDELNAILREVHPLSSCRENGSA